MATSYDPEKDRESSTDLCVLCGKDTGVPKGTHVDGRAFYVEGCGQLCRECGIEQYQK